MKTACDYLVVGAGLFGAVVAERLASQTGRTVLVIDRREHTGGNCRSEVDAATGIEFHRYGPHVFHTSDAGAWDYLQAFTGFTSYRHRVLARVGKRSFPIPINLATINAFFGRTFTAAEAQACIASRTQPPPAGVPANFEEQALATIGRELYEAFFAGYTRKQWGREPRELPAEIFSRLPLRFDSCPDYFPACRWQGLPVDGYAALFDRLLAHPLISVATGVEYAAIRPHVAVRRRTVYTGAPDEFFDHCLGRLEWRSVRFERDIVPVADYQQLATVNYPDPEVPHTRVHEPRHFHPERAYPAAAGRSVIIHEYPCVDPDNPCYPVRTPDNLDLFGQYCSLARREAPEVVFGGRLGSFAYLDMDKTVAAALRCAALLATDDRSPA